MSAIPFAVNQIMHSVPTLALNRAFRTETSDNRFSTEELITNKCIRSRLLPWLNVVGGEDVYVPTSLCQVLDLDEDSVTYLIPSQILNHRGVVSAISAHYDGAGGSVPGSSQMLGSLNGGSIRGTHGNTGCNSGGMLGRLSESIMSASSKNLPIIGNADVSLSGNNVIIVRGSGLNAISYLKVTIADDPDLNNLNPRFYPLFTKIARLAVESYVYNELSIRLGSGYIQNGAELNQLSDYVQRNESKNDELEEAIATKWPKAAIMNDTRAYHDLIRSQSSLM